MDLDAYLAFAFQQAGIVALRSPPSIGTDGSMPFPRTTALISELEKRDQPCVLALDELERVSNSNCVDLLNFVLANAPPCLHLALAYRNLPYAFNAATHVLDSAEILGAEDLRFSKGEIARFFDLSLSRNQLAAVATDSQGWPIALHICRNDDPSRWDGRARAARDAIETWIDARFLSAFANNDRELVMDLGLFDWFDDNLLDNVFDSPNVLRRVLNLPGLAGLLAASGGPARWVYRLHPLLRDHCAARRQRNALERYRYIHQRIANALAERGVVVEAMRHATEGGDAKRVGSILADAGGLQWWLIEGSDQLLAASRYLTDESVKSDPRLAFARCVAQVVMGRLADAHRTFATAPASSPLAGFDNQRRLARGMLVFNSCLPMDSIEVREVSAEALRVVGLPDAPAAERSAAAVALCSHLLQQARFDDARSFGRQARRLAAGRSALMGMSADSFLGQVAMVTGQIREAIRRYRSAHRAAKEHFLRSPGLTLHPEMLLCELDLERYRPRVPSDVVRIAKTVYRVGGHPSHYAASSDMAIEAALDSGGTIDAFSVVDWMCEHLRTAGLRGLEVHLAALRVSLLAVQGNPDDAERAWRASGLPETDSHCLDLDRWSWRELEAIACARLRLYAARGEVSAGDSLAEDLVRIAVERRLRRTLMRALALRLQIRHAAGDSQGARSTAYEFLRLYARTDYARPFVRIGRPGVKTLERLLYTGVDDRVEAAAKRLLAIVRSACDPSVPTLSIREQAVLERLATQQDKQIAKALDLTVHGVRYHIRNVFRKLEVSTRVEAVHRARALAILPSQHC